MRQDRPGLQGLCVLSPPAARSPAPPLCLTSLSFPSVRACGRRSAQRTCSRAGSWRRGRGGAGRGRAGAGRSRSPAPPSPAPPREAAASLRAGSARRLWAQRREHAAPREPGRVSAAGAAGAAEAGGAAGGVSPEDTPGAAGPGCSLSAEHPLLPVPTRSLTPLPQFLSPNPTLGPQ